MARQVGDDLVILDPESGRYFGLNAVGALVWDRLENEATLDDLVTAVVSEYDVDKEQATVDVRDLVEQLADRSLLAT